MKNYQEQAKRTNADLGSEKLNLAHMIVGVISELNELENAIDNRDIVNIGEEIADHFWYLANYCTIRNLDFNEYLVHENMLDGNSHILDLYYEVSMLSDIVKKHIAYNKPIDKKIEHILLSNVFYYLCDVTFMNVLNLNQILEKNIEKLKIRFPDKFTEEQAINRNTDKEYEKLK